MEQAPPTAESAADNLQALLKVLGCVGVESSLPLILTTDMDGAIFSEGLLKVRSANPTWSTLVDQHI